MSRNYRIFKQITCFMLAAILLCTSFSFKASAAKSGTVKGDDVRLRSEPNTESDVVNVLNSGSELTIIESTSDGWLKVNYTDSEGNLYVGYLAADLVDVPDTLAVNNAGVTQTATISGGGVRLRSEPNTDSSILVVLADGDVVNILDSDIEGWIKVTYQGESDLITGYIASDYLYTNPMATGVTTRVSVIMRSDMSSDSEIVSILPADAEIDVLDTYDSWTEVTYNGETGYVEKDYLTTESDSACIGYGTVVADTLCLRSEPSTDGEILSGLSAGVTFQITSNDTPGWYGAIFNGMSGYVSSDYVAFSDNIDSGYIQVTASSLSLRAGAGTQFTKLTLIPEGTVLAVSGSYGSWYQVSYNGFTGYVSGSYVSSTTKDGFRYFPKFAKITATSLALRSSPSTDASILDMIANGVVVEVLAKTGDFYQVKYDGKTGYIGYSFTVEDDGPATVIVHETTSSSSNRTSSSSSGNYSGGSTVSGSTGSSIADYACQFYGNPYVWGGTSLTNGCDCSGFVMQVYAHFGYSLPHSSSAQRGYGQSVSLADIQPGDIVCYNHHVGIYVGDGKIISALGKNYGITYSSVTYKSIITIRRIFS